MTGMLGKIYQGERSYLLAKILPPAIFCAVTFLATVFFSYLVSVEDIAWARQMFSDISQAFEEKGLLEPMSNFELFLMIFANNATAGFFVLLSGIVPFIFLPFWAVVSNAALAGIVIAVSVDSGAVIGKVMLSLLPHGSVELPALFLTAGLGLRVGFVATKKVLGAGKDLSFKKEMALAWKSFILVALPLFFIAAFIEAFVTILIVGA